MPKETHCPNCNAYIPLDVYDRIGHVVYCSFCGIGLRIIAEPPEPGKDWVVKEMEDEE